MTHISLWIIIGWLILSTVVGVLAGVKRKFSMEEWFVGQRGFGLILFYVVAAAEIYSAFAFLGLAGWAYKFGAPIYYAPMYNVLAYTLFFFIGPLIWKYGKTHGYVTQPDFFIHRYQSPSLGVAVAIIGFLFTIPYLQLQIMGTGMIIQVSSGGAINWQAAVIVSSLASIIFVTVSGLRGIAWTNFLQAILMLVTMFSVGFLFPHKFFGGVGEMFRRLAEVSPQHLILPGKAGTLGLGWYTSTTLMSALGFWMWPHLFLTTYSAKNIQIIRRNAVILPLFAFALIPIIIVGYTCFLMAPGLKEPDHAMLITLTRFFPSWVAGVVGAGGMAAAISTSSALTLSACTLFSRNIYQKGINPRASDDQTVRLARALVPVVTVLAVVLTFMRPKMLVTLLLLGYSGIAQFFPGVFLGLFWRRATKAGIYAGMIAGIGSLLAVNFGLLRFPFGLFFGFWGLLINLTVCLLVTLLTSPPPKEALDQFYSA
jgi:SSS family solute:Na+ symporter